MPKYTVPHTRVTTIYETILPHHDTGNTAPALKRINTIPMAGEHPGWQAHVKTVIEHQTATNKKAAKKTAAKT